MIRTRFKDSNRVAALFGFALFSHIAIANEQIVSTQPGALSEIIANAQVGDVIQLIPGEYSGPITIDKPLTLDGGGKAKITGNGTGSVITVTAPDVKINGLTLTGSGLSHETLDAGVKLTKTAHRAVIKNNEILNNLTGVDVHGAKNAVVTGNLIVGRQDLRMNERGNGIYVWNSPDLLVEDNIVQFGRDGVFVNTSHNDTIRGNQFTDLRFAIHYMHGHSGIVERNYSSNNDIGYALMFSDRLEVKNNISINDRDHGLMLNYANRAQIIGNQISNGGEKCLFMYNANKNEVAENRLERCPIGVHFTGGSSKNTFQGNSFLNNKTQVKFVGSKVLEWSKEGKGNYWSDHAAFDLNGDGLADTSYRPNDIVDQILWTQPVAKLLLGSPAIQLLRWVQSQFPTLLPGGIVDSAPLMQPPGYDATVIGVRG